MGLFNFLKNPIGDLIEKVGGVVDRFVTTGDDKLKAQFELVKLERDFQMQVMQLDQKWAETQADVIKSEATSQSWLARNWRPILMLVFTYIVAHNYVFAPVLGAFTTKVAAVPLPPEMWDLLKIGMGGYIVGRSAEKIAPAITEIVTNKKK